MKTHGDTLRFGLTGLGGYAGYACDRLLAEALRPHPAARLVGVCEPELERFPRRVEELRANGVLVVRDFAQLLDQPIDAVWLPLPIDLHLSFTETVLASGKAVLCEKPAAGCVDDVDRMIAARDRTKLPVAIGFQDIYQPAVATLKNRLLAGEFGKPIGARVIGCWPRSEGYFARATRGPGDSAAGADGCWIMDSPASNALAHFIHLTLFLLGPTRQQSACVTEVAAELYRANRIENYDTCSMRLRVGQGGPAGSDVPVLVACTHACATPVEPVIVLDTERAQIRYVAEGRIEIRIHGENNNGPAEVLELSSDPYGHMFTAFRAWCRDGVDSALGSTLEMARAHVVAVNAASEVAPVVDVPDAYVDVIPTPDQSVLRAIRDVVEAMEACTLKQCLLNETGHAPWSHPPAQTAINGYAHFAGPAKSRLPTSISVETFIAPSATTAVANV